MRPLTMVTAIGAVAATASIGIVAAPPAFAVDYPTWGDVQAAKNNVTQQKALVQQITTLVGNLQGAVETAQTKAEEASEAYFEAKDALDAATTRANDLQQRATAAADRAKVSRMRAGLLASHLARTGGQDIPIDLFMQGNDSSGANKLLYQLGTMSKLTQKSQDVYQQAVSDKNEADSLSSQAAAARQARQKLSEQATAALAGAQQAQQAASNALNTQQSKQTQLTAQLASLQNTSAQVSAQYVAGVQAAAAAAAAAAALKAQQEALARQQAENEAAAQNAGHPGGQSAGSGYGSGSVSAPPPIGNVGAASGSVVAQAIAYAEAQLGKPYIFGGQGPVGYDCSGLTMMAYRSAGVYIGTHSVNNQWYTAASRGEIASYSDREPGDLLFWGAGPGSFYHVGIYLGGGMMIAAPTYGEQVKIQAVWGTPYGAVARPGA